MKIAFIVGGFPKLSETWILTQIRGLLARGHEVDVFARRRLAEQEVQPDVRALNLLARTRYLELPHARPARLARALRAGAAVLGGEPRAAFRCLNLARYRSLYAVLNNLMLVEAFLGRRYDAVLCHFGGNGIDFIVLKEVFPRARFVTMFHGDDYAIGDEKGPQAFAALKTLGDAFLVTTDCFGRATLRRYGFPEEKIVTLRLSIVTKDIVFREARAPDGMLRLLSVGRLVEKKDFATGIRAVARLAAARPGLAIRYRIIGDGPLRSDLEALASALGVADRVDLAGPGTTLEVMRAMQESDIYLLPSVMEQAGFVLLEAQATGLPVLASRVGGVPEMVREGASAVLAAPTDAAAFAEGLGQLVERRGHWPAMARQGRRHVEEHFDVDVVTPGLERVLQSNVAPPADRLEDAAPPPATQPPLGLLKAPFEHPLGR